MPWLAGLLALTVVWALGASAIILFHDAVLARFVAGQVAMRAAYEARLAELREGIDRTRAERTERAGTEAALAARVAAALERQAELERRQAALAGLAEPAFTGALPAATPLPAPAPLPSPPPAEAAPAAEPGLGLRSAREAEAGLIRLEARLDGVQEAQGERLVRVSAGAASALARLRVVLGRTGLDPARLDPAAAAPGFGGPYVPLDATRLGGAGFDGALTLVRRSLGDARRLRRLAAELPLRRPLRGEVAVSSPFGTRLDPFTRGLALHTGLDLKAEYGEPARATAPGVVTAAERAGGYGNMVEIDHGHGLVTRFGHLARIDVRPGQRLPAGAVVGLVGSTGRSTGAHLHYETRVDGEPTDPLRFLEAGRALAIAAAE